MILDNDAGRKNYDYDYHHDDGVKGKKNTVKNSFMNTNKVKEWSKYTRKGKHSLETAYKKEKRTLQFAGVYLPTWVSKTFPQKSVFANTNKTPGRTLKVTKTNRANHKTAAIEKNLLTLFS